MNDYKISVLVTFYNQEMYVDKALTSIFDQKTDFDFKVIIGDDGSTDGTVGRIKKWMEKYPEIELNVRDHNDGCTIGGFRASRNRLDLLKRVDTKYFIFLDGDDYFSDENKFQIQYDIMEKDENRDCIVCAHNINALYNNGEIKPYTSLNIPEGKYGKREYWANYYFHTDTMLFRSKLIKKLDFNLLENNYNDNMITFTAIQFGKIYYLPQYMAVYNQTGDGIWTTGNQIINNIRNMFLYDICNVVAPNMKKETNIRFFSTWKNLYALRKEIDPNMKNYSVFLSEADGKGFKYSEFWLKYDKISVFSKLSILKDAAYIVICGYSFKIKRKLKKLISG